MKRPAALAFIFALLAGNVLAQGQDETMRFWIEADPPSVRPGEEFTLTIRSDVPWDFGVHVPRSFSFVGPFAVVKDFQAVPVEPGVRRLSSAHYRLQAPAETGSLEIPPITAYVQLVRRPTLKDCTPLDRELSVVERFYEGCLGIARARGFRMEVGKRFTMESDPLVVIVHQNVPPEADTLAPRELAPPVFLPGAENVDIIRLLGTLAAVIAILLLAVFAFRRRRQPEPEREELVVFTGKGASAREALDAFERITKNLSGCAGSFRPVYEEIARVLRGYIDRRLAYPAPRRTTEETLEGLPAAVARTQGLSPGTLREDAKAVLVACDEVKFSGRDATRDEVGNVLMSARRFVKTSPDLAR